MTAIGTPHVRAGYQFLLQVNDLVQRVEVLAWPLEGDWKQGEQAAAIQPGAKYYGLLSGTLAIKSWDGTEDFGTVYAGGMDVGELHWKGDEAAKNERLPAAHCAPF